MLPTTDGYGSATALLKFPSGLYMKGKSEAGGWFILTALQDMMCSGKRPRSICQSTSTEMESVIWTASSLEMSQPLAVAKTILDEP